MHAQPSRNGGAVPPDAEQTGAADSAAASARLVELGHTINARIDEAEKRIAGQRAQVVEGLEDMAHDIAAEVYSKVSGQPADGTALRAKVAAAKGGR